MSDTPTTDAIEAALDNPCERFSPEYLYVAAMCRCRRLERALRVELEDAKRLGLDFRVARIEEALK